MGLDKHEIAARFAQLPPEKQRLFLQALQGQGVDFARLPIVPLKDRSAAVASHGQWRQWFLWQMDRGSAAYHIIGALRLSGEVDTGALQASIDGLLEQHESLRTVFQAHEDGLCVPRVRAGGREGWEFHPVDVSAEGAEGALERADREARRISQLPFDLERGPLLRVGLVRMAPSDHLLVLAMHHIISDGWSMRILVEDLMALYGAHRGGVPSPLQRTAVGYADYATWQRNWLEAGERDRQLAYWTGQLGPATPVLELPVDQPRRPGGRSGVAKHSVRLQADRVRPLRDRAHGAGTTLFTVLLAGFQVLLHRLTGEGDIRVGVPVANRARPEVERVIGLCVNTQVQRNVMEGRTPLSEVLARAREAVLGAQACQDLPFEQLVEALCPERADGVNPLFQVMFDHAPARAVDMSRLPGLVVDEYALAAPEAQFELVLGTREEPDGGLQVQFMYAADRFLPETVARFAEAYAAILQALAADIDGAVGDIRILGEGDRAALQRWSANPCEEPVHERVHEAIARQARERPGAVALLFGDEALDYATLDERANRLAHRLRALGVGPDVRVGIAMERSTEMVVSWLAVLKAGGAYLPLDPDYPPQRLAYMVEDSGVRWVLAHGATRGRFEVAAGVEWVDVDALDLRAEPSADPGVAVHGENLAYVIYTSGSTGRPKGAAIRHAALSSCMAWMQRTYGLAPEDAVLHKAPFGFDVSVWEMFWPLTVGARLVVARPGDHRDPERIVELIQRHRVTTLNFVPSMLQAFLAHPGIEERTGLRHIICGGEAMPVQTQREALRRLQGATLQNLYGPTETTIHVTQWTCRDDGRNAVPIGNPISGTHAHVLDAHLNPAPIGVPGELYIGGISLARGYLNRPGLTAERFVADPQDPRGGRLYRTGDLVRWSPQGHIEYLGRIDHQVKIRGLRMELGEIEAQICAQPGVREAAVVARDGATGTRLVGYVVPREGCVVDPVALRRSLAQALPDYMLPRDVIVLDALPLSANGKVDRQALPAPAEPLDGQAQAVPDEPVARRLAGLWQEVLRVPSVGGQDNFFERGGDSLLCLQLLARIRKAFPGAEGFGLVDVMQSAHLLDMAQRLRDQDAPPAHDAVCLQAGGSGVPIFCLPGLVVNTREFQPLAQALGGQRPVFGFVSHVYTRHRWQGFDIPALAARYADFIAAHARDGRCALLGWSIGGELAYEVARQLQGRVEVVFCAMVDVFEGEPMQPARALSGPERASAAEALQQWLERSTMRGRWEALLARMTAAERDWVAERMLEAAGAFPLDGSGDDAHEYLLWATLDSRMWQARMHFGAQDLPVHVFQAEASLHRTPALRRWDAHARVVASGVVAGADHLSIIGHPTFCQRLRAHIDAVDEARADAVEPADAV
ncbi:amino acid adenylation domain-containing protein [Acidovorax sp. NCPPB 2350]|nr:amino acid adenylation domain-containing protein [Acidovorax sp. NCPPB 2350]